MRTTLIHACLLASILPLGLASCFSQEKHTKSSIRERLYLSQQLHLDALDSTPSIKLTDPHTGAPLLEASYQWSLSPQIPIINATGTDLLGRQHIQATNISLDMCIVAALEGAMQLQVARIETENSNYRIDQADANFDARITGNVSGSFSETPQPDGSIPGLSGSTETSQYSGRIGLAQRTRSGGEFEIFGRLSRSERSPSFFATDRFHDADLGMTFNQNLLRDRGSEITQANLTLARIEAINADQSLRQQMAQTIQAVANAYWDVAAARDRAIIMAEWYNIGIELEASLGGRVGYDLTESDLAQIKSSTAARHRELLQAQTDWHRASDRLKRLMSHSELSLFSEILLLPADQPLLGELQIDYPEALRTALSNRPEVQQNLLAIDQGDIRQQLAENTMLPLLNLSAGVTLNGIDNGDALDAFAEASTAEALDFSIGLQFEQALGRNFARAERAIADNQQQQNILRYQDGLQDITLEVKDALRNVMLQHSSLRASRAQVAASEQALEGSQQRLKLGGRSQDTYTTLIQQTITQQDSLARARMAESQTSANLLQSIVNLDYATGQTLARYGIATLQDTTTTRQP